MPRNRRSYCARFVTFWVALLCALATSCRPSDESKNQIGKEPVRPAIQRAPAKRTIPELIRDLGKDGLEGHADHTPAGDALIEIGEPAIEPVLRVMLHGNWYERTCAERVLCEITSLQHGWRTVPDWSSSPLHESWLRFWNRLGPLRADDPYKQRWAATQNWLAWLDRKRLCR